MSSYIWTFIYSMSLNIYLCFPKSIKKSKKLPTSFVCVSNFELCSPFHKIQINDLFMYPDWPTTVVQRGELNFYLQYVPVHHWEWCLLAFWKNIYLCFPKSIKKLIKKLPTSFVCVPNFELCSPFHKIQINHLFIIMPFGHSGGSNNHNHHNNKRSKEHCEIPRFWFIVYLRVHSIIL